MGFLFASKAEKEREARLEETQRSQAAAADPFRLRLGERQRRHGQDARADHARAAPAARRHAARAHPGAHVHQGRRRGDVEARVRAACRVGDGRRGEPEAQARRAARPLAHLGRDAVGAAAVRHRHRDARRPQGADHPRLLRAAAAAVSARGRRAAGLRHPRRARARRAAESRRPTRCSPRPRARRRRPCGRRCRRPSPMPSTTASTTS